MSYVDVENTFPYNPMMEGFPLAAHSFDSFAIEFSVHVYPVGDCFPELDAGFK